MNILEKMWDKALEFVLNEPDTWKGFVSIYFIFLLIILSIHQFIKDDYNFELYTYLLIGLLILLGWLIFKYKYPKNNKKQTGIVIALHAKNFEALKLKKKFVEELKKSIEDASLGDVFNVIVLKNHHAKIVKKQNVKEINIKVGGHFWLLGDITKERDGDNEKYFINFEGYVVHKLTPIPICEELGFDFRKTLPKEINFPDFFGYRMIKSTGKIAYLSALYVVGVASFISENPFLAYRLHNKLLSDFGEYKKIISNTEGKSEIDKIDIKYLFKLEKKIPKLISNEAMIISMVYKINGGKEGFQKFLQIAKDNNPQNYGIWLLEAISIFEDTQDTLVSKECIKKAEKFANGTFEWRYSKAFLLFWDEKYQEAYKECEKINISSYENELKTVEEVEEFNLNILKKRQDKPQLYFWIGYIIYKKRGDTQLAKQYFENFLSNSNESNNFLELKTKTFLSEINKLICQQT